MEWTAQFDAYCERVGFDYWAEPINAITNAAFLIAALIMWPRVRGLPIGQMLCVILAAIGIGSYLFHTHATGWAATADVVPIVLFILVYIYATGLHYLNLSPLWSGLAVLAFFPYAAAFVPLFNALPFFEISAAYWPVALLIFGVGFALRTRLKRTSSGLMIGAGILTLSLTFRSLDELVCASLPLGTHFMWHLLNGVMLGWMIEVYRRHMLAGRARDR